MLEFEFILEVSTYRPILLGDTEKKFLRLIGEGHKSAFDIFSELRYLNSIYKTKTMAYKNVYTRIQRLHELELIRPVRGKFKRNAIKYQLTSRGLFQYLLTVGHFFSWDILHIYKEEVLLRAILYQYFDQETIKIFASSVHFQLISSLALLPDCLRKCCEAILKKLEDFRLRVSHRQKSGMAITIPEYEIYKLGKQIDESINREIRDFVFEIITFLKYQGQDEDIAESQMILRKDKKFIALLKEIRKNFDEGYKHFILFQ